MKKTLFYFFCLLALSFVSCNNDNDPISDCEQVVSQVKEFIDRQGLDRVELFINGQRQHFDEPFVIEDSFIIIGFTYYNLCNVVLFNSLQGRVRLFI